MNNMWPFIRKPKKQYNDDILYDFYYAAKKNNFRVPHPFQIIDRRGVVYGNTCIIKISGVEVAKVHTCLYGYDEIKLTDAGKAMRDDILREMSNYIEYQKTLYRKTFEDDVAKLRNAFSKKDT